MENKAYGTLIFQKQFVIGPYHISLTAVLRQENRGSASIRENTVFFNMSSSFVWWSRISLSDLSKVCQADPFWEACALIQTNAAVTSNIGKLHTSQDCYSEHLVWSEHTACLLLDIFILF